MFVLSIKHLLSFKNEHFKLVRQLSSYQKQILEKYAENMEILC